ncbi:complement C1q-like protein 2 [Dreissena polymorpha]|uniref:C1q domain-containing protein n=1 Tax=Dreissena polymorpha TaxID=45954 RepID=A0A9D4KSC9_DREPO|nr:complement C1q-like protein 2 [Dreissena polymorpha]KAH3844833.1 hypothetical protein DPMN_087097 [Dreissena polymorpha]
MSVTVYNITYLLAQISTLEKTQLEIKGATDKTSAQIGTVEQKVSSQQSNFDKLQSRVFAIEDTQRDLKSKTRTIETQVDTTQGLISRLQSITRTFAGFYARLIKKSDHYTNGTVITFDDVVYNDGSHYNPSTGIFTVPVSGVYVFMFNVEVNFNSRETNREAHVDLNVNGNMRADALVSGVAALSGGNAAVLKVTAGDKVYVSTARYEERYYIRMYRTSFSGALLYVS